MMVARDDWGGPYIRRAGRGQNSAGRGGAEVKICGAGRGRAKKRVNQQACSINGGGPCHPEVQSPSP